MYILEGVKGQQDDLSNILVRQAKLVGLENKYTFGTN